MARKLDPVMEKASFMFYGQRLNYGRWLCRIAHRSCILRISRSLLPTWTSVEAAASLKQVCVIVLSNSVLRNAGHTFFLMESDEVPQLEVLQPFRCPEILGNMLPKSALRAAHLIPKHRTLIDLNHYWQVRNICTCDVRVVIYQSMKARGRDLFLIPWFEQLGRPDICGPMSFTRFEPTRQGE